MSLLLFFLSLALVPAALGSFSIELIHRDSPVSPLYEPSATRFDRWSMAVERSLERASHFAIVSPIRSNAGTYLTKVTLGTPPFDVHVIADTGSDLSWTNCIPCTDCYKQKDPLFNPARSSSYSNIPCPSTPCSALPRWECDKANNCQYQYTYVDGSTAIGLLAKEKFTFNSVSHGKVSIPATLFGCSHKSSGTFNINSGGVVGLGAGELSLVSQLGDDIDNQFSYCLVPEAHVQASSHLVFGHHDRAPRGKISRTPIIKNAKHSNLYFLNLVKVIIGEKSIPVPGASSASSSGNIVIDSGTTLTILHKSVVDEVATEIKKVLKLPPLTDPKYHDLGTCFATDGTKIQFPQMSFVFDGASVLLPPTNMFFQAEKNVLCLALKSADGIQIYGSLAQQDFYVSYDLRQQMLSIAPANCAQF